MAHALITPDQAYFPSAIARMGVARGSRDDAVEQLLAETDRRGLAVFLSVSWDMTRKAPYQDRMGQITALMEELFTLYAGHPSLAGFYSYQEGSGTYYVPYVRQFTGHVKRLNPGLLSACAPFVDDPLLAGYLSTVETLEVMIFQAQVMASYCTDNPKRYPLRRVRDFAALGIGAKWLQDKIAITHVELFGYLENRPDPQVLAAEGSSCTLPAAEGPPWTATTARVLATFGDGSPAVLANTYGSGLAIAILPSAGELAADCSALMRDVLEHALTHARHSTLADVRGLSEASDVAVSPTADGFAVAVVNHETSSRAVEIRPLQQDGTWFDAISNRPLTPASEGPLRVDVPPSAACGSSSCVARQGSGRERRSSLEARFSRHGGGGAGRTGGDHIRAPRGGHGLRPAPGCRPSLCRLFARRAAGPVPTRSLRGLPDIRGTARRRSRARRVHVRGGSRRPPDLEQQEQLVRRPRPVGARISLQPLWARPSTARDCAEDGRVPPPHAAGRRGRPLATHLHARRAGAPARRRRGLWRSVRGRRSRGVRARDRRQQARGYGARAGPEMRPPVRPRRLPSRDRPDLSRARCARVPGGAHPRRLDGPAARVHPDARARRRCPNRGGRQAFGRRDHERPPQSRVRAAQRVAEARPVAPGQRVRTARLHRHCVEVLWMLLDEARRRGDAALLDLATARFRRHIAVAWDDVFGEVFRNLQHVERNVWLVDKVLWAQEEVLIGTLRLVEDGVE